ncbi:MAG: septum formation protein Maf [Anaerolineales bacterium]|nr:septum formation protein Maf [Anaerolineales bacterium]
MIPDFILASASPRRKALLHMLAIPFTVELADVDEDSIVVADPLLNVQRRSILKAAGLEVAKRHPVVILAADTIVTIDGDILNKPATTDEAREMLQRLRGRPHEVLTSITLRDNLSGKTTTEVDRVQVYMRPYTDDEIEAYIATGDPMDKAGAYAIQHPEFQPVAQLTGCYLTVMGLSLCHLLTLLPQFSISASMAEHKLKQLHQNYPCAWLSSSSPHVL